MHMMAGDGIAGVRAVAPATAVTTPAPAPRQGLVRNSDAPAPGTDS